MSAVRSGWTKPGKGSCGGRGQGILMLSAFAIQPQYDMGDSGGLGAMGIVFGIVYLAIAVLRYVTIKRNMRWFSYYMWVAGLTTIILSLSL